MRTIPCGKSVLSEKAVPAKEGIAVDPGLWKCRKRICSRLLPFSGVNIGKKQAEVKQAIAQNQVR